MGFSVLVPATLAYFSGGTRRLYQLLQRGYKHGIHYILVTSKNQFEKSLRVYPDLPRIMGSCTVYFINDNIPTHIWLYGPDRSRNILQVGLCLGKIAKKEHPDIIVSPYEAPGYIFVSYIAGKNSRIPWTCVLQSVPILGLSIPILGNLNPEVLSGGIWNAFLKAPGIRKLKGKGICMVEMLLILRLLRKTVSLSISESVSYELGLFDPKLEFLLLDPPVGVDLEKLDKIKPSTKGFDAIFFSRLLSTKGLLDLPLIWKHVITHNPELTLAVAGPSPIPKDLTKFFELVDKLSLEKNVIYLGEQSWENMMMYAKASKVMLYPSRSDSFPTVVLESLACGLPVVAYDIPALKINFGGISAVKLLPRDFKRMAEKVIFLIENEDLRKRLSVDALSFAQKYTWEAVIRAELEAYNRVIELLD